MEKENKDYAIEKKDQKSLRGISKFFYIVANILKVFAIIGMVGLVLAMVIVPIVTSNIKVVKNGNEHILKVFDTGFNYERSDSYFALYEKGKTDDKLEFTEKKEVEAANTIMDYLEKNNLTVMTILVEVEFLLVGATLFIEVLVLKKVHTFFKNIHDESTPFIEENIELLRSTAKLLIYSLCASVILSILSSFLFNSESTYQLANIAEILFVYFLIYIFEYGYKMQNSTKGKIYSSGE